MCPRIGGMPGRRGIAVTAVVAVLLSPLVSNRALAETIILKNGSSVPCRILREGSEEVVVRTAGGMEVTFRKQDIARIDRSVSSVELLEGVGESISETNLSTALHLGYWCLEKGLKDEAKGFFEVATGDSVVSARAYLALSELAGTEATKRALLEKAVSADPSLDEVMNALAGSGSAQVGLSEDLLALGSQLFGAVVYRGTREITGCLSAIDRHPDAAARDAFEERFRAFTGLSFAEIRERCRARGSGSRRTSDSDGHCRYCGGTGYTDCPLCKGKGYVLCRTCKGRGTVTGKKRSSRGTTTSVTKTCPGCGGTGGKDCRSCVRLPAGRTDVTRYVTTDEPCRVCDGTGTSSAPSPYSRSGTNTSSVCRACNGTGLAKRRCDVALTITSSGKRRCSRCNKDGHIPLNQAGRPERPPVRAPTTSSSAKSDSILEPEERARLEPLREVFIREGAGTGIRWQAGPRVPFGFSVAKQEDDSSREVFAFGQWCTPSTRDLKEKTARALGYKPRAVDISKFIEWMRDSELAYLRRKASPIGGGAGARDDNPTPDNVRALVTTIECARRAGVGGGLEQSAIVCTTFSPGGAAGGRKDDGKAPLTCRLDRSARGISLLLLKDTESWPGCEVVLSPLSDDPSGLDFESVEKEIRSDPRALTLYYRIRSSREEMAGQGIRAVRRVMLSAEVLGATLGPKDRPTKVWLRGLSDA